MESKNLDSLLSALLLAFAKFQSKEIELDVAGFFNKCPTQKKRQGEKNKKRFYLRHTHTHTFRKRDQPLCSYANAAFRSKSSQTRTKKRHGAAARSRTSLRLSGSDGSLFLLLALVILFACPTSTFLK